MTEHTFDPVWRAADMRGSRLFGALLLAVWLTVAVLAVQLGADYYRTPLVDRPFSADHELFKPSGIVGHGFGIAGTAMMLVGVALYSTRKRVSWLASAGALGNWLQFHIFLCTLGPDQHLGRYLPEVKPRGCDG